MMVGLFVTGFGDCMCYVPTAVEIINANTEIEREKLYKKYSEEDYTGDLLKEKVNQDFQRMVGPLTDKALALQSIALSTGSAFGPIIGGKLADSFGFTTAVNIMSLSALTVCVVNFCFVILPDLVC